MSNQTYTHILECIITFNRTLTQCQFHIGENIYVKIIPPVANIDEDLRVKMHMNVNGESE